MLSNQNKEEKEKEQQNRFRAQSEKIKTLSSVAKQLSLPSDLIAANSDKDLIKSTPMLLKPDYQIM